MIDYKQVIPGRQGLMGWLASLQVKNLIPEQCRPIGYLNHLTKKRTGKMVRSEPFEGMRYVDVSQGSCYIPKLLGIYERELHAVVEELIGYAPQTVIDLGAAEGYYAVGVARRLPDARVIAFEMEERGRTALAAMAALNGVADRVEVRGKCEAADLRAVLTNSRKATVICDVEGYEDVLLDPGSVPALADTRILVELHDFIGPGLCERLTERFTPTHSVERIWQADRNTSEFPWTTLGTRLVLKEYLVWAVNEWRPVRMSWLSMVPKDLP